MAAKTSVTLGGGVGGLVLANDGPASCRGLKQASALPKFLPWLAISPSFCGDRILHLADTFLANRIPQVGLCDLYVCDVGGMV